MYTGERVHHRPVNKDTVAVTYTQYFVIPDLDFNHKGRFHRPYLSMHVHEFCQWVVDMQPENSSM